MILNQYPLKSVNIADGVTFNSVIDNRFKTNKISINFITELNKETVTENAILPSILKKGTKKYSDFTEFNRKLQELYGAYVSGYVQKNGDLQIISLSITGIDDKFTLDGDVVTKNISEILCDMALDPVMENGFFRKSDIELEKGTLIDTIEAEINEKRIYAINNLIRTMCSNEAFGIPKYGFVKDAKSLTTQRITNSYNNLISNARIEIMFVGCGNDEPAKEVFADKFKSVKRNNILLKESEIHHKNNELIEKIDEMSVAQSKMVLGFTNELASGDKMVIPTKLMIAILGGTASSKLFLNVREKLSLCYYCAARYDRFKGIMIVDCGVETENIEKAKNEIMVQLNLTKSGEITDDEIVAAKLALKNALETISDSESSVEAWYLGQILSKTSNSPEDDIAKIDNVTKEEIVESANKMQLDCVYTLTNRTEVKEG
ncbi:MAG: insulinase family protein [Oscillospiraceae bacterium]